MVQPLLLFGRGPMNSDIRCGEKVFCEIIGMLLQKSQDDKKEFPRLFPGMDTCVLMMLTTRERKQKEF